MIKKKNQVVRLALLTMVTVASGTQLPCTLSDGTVCPSSLCPNISITLTCTFPPSATLHGYTLWKLPSGTCSSKSDQLVFIQDALTNCASASYDNCGGYTSRVIGCRSSTMSATTTIGTNGSVLSCLNAYNGSVGDLVGSAVIQLVPIQLTTPTLPEIISLEQSSNNITMQWGSSATGGDPSYYSVTVRMGATVVATISVGRNIYTHTFLGLISDVLYTVSVIATNCAGSNEVRKTISTLPSLPSNVSAVKVLCSSTTQYTVITWISTMTSNMNYSLSVIDETATYANCSKYACLDFTCYCRLSYIASTVQIAIIGSTGLIGPYTQPIASDDGSTKCSLFVSITTLQNQAIIKCTFLDGLAHYCLVSCSSQQYGPYVYSVMTNSGLVVFGTLNNLTSRHMYFCKAAAITSATMLQSVENIPGTLMINFTTLISIKVQQSSFVNTNIVFQDESSADIECTFLDHLSHYCLICCSGEANMSTVLVSNISRYKGIQVTVHLSGLDDPAYYCAAIEDSSICITQVTTNSEETTIIVSTVIMSTTVVMVVLSIAVIFAWYKLHHKVSDKRIGKLDKDNAACKSHDKDQIAATHDRNVKLGVELACKSNNNTHHVDDVRKVGDNVAYNSSSEVDKILEDQMTVPSVVKVMKVGDNIAYKSSNEAGSMLDDQVTYRSGVNPKQMKVKVQDNIAYKSNDEAAVMLDDELTKKSERGTKTVRLVMDDNVAYKTGDVVISMLEHEVTRGGDPIPMIATVTDNVAYRSNDEATSMLECHQSGINAMVKINDNVAYKSADDAASMLKITQTSGGGATKEKLKLEDSNDYI